MMQAVCWRRPTSAPAGGNRTTPTDEMTLAADLYAALQVGPVLPMPRPWLSRCWMSVMLCSAGLVDGWLQCKSSSHYEDGMNQSAPLVWAALGSRLGVMRGPCSSHTCRAAVRAASSKPVS